MAEEKTVYVSWYTCDCDWVTKYCDLMHTEGVRIPLSKIKEWIKEENR